MPTRPLTEVVTVFLRLGATAFGGPAAHIAMMRRELVERRGWQDEQTFTDLIGLTALIPGPSSTELAIEMGRRRAGPSGLVAAGVAFIMPAVLIVGTLAWAYDRYSTTPAADDLRYGITPVVLAIIVSAIWVLRPTAVTGPLTAVIAAGAMVLFLNDVHELAVLAGGALIAWGWAQRHRVRPARLGLCLALGIPAMTGAGADANGIGLLSLFWSFFRIGATLFGSGYVLIAFLDAEFVQRLGVLTEGQLLDAVAIGQITPGPLFSTATFVGYLVAGVDGAVVASLAIFLPAFLLIATLGRFIEGLLGRPGIRELLDGLNAAAIGLIAGTAIEIAGTATDDVLTVTVAVASLAVLVSTKLNPTWLIAAGAVIGLGHGAIM